MPDLQISAPTGLPQVVTSTTLDAPRTLVFRAFTDPALLAAWFGPDDLTITIDRFEARDGGRWRIVHTDAEGRQYAVHGVYHGRPTPESTVRTSEFEGAPGHVMLERLELEEQDGRTFLRSTSLFQTFHHRDAMVESGMGQGIRASFERLERLLEWLQRTGSEEAPPAGRAA